jgi:hypothetical protein
MAFVSQRSASRSSPGAFGAALPALAGLVPTLLLLACGGGDPARKPRGDSAPNDIFVFQLDFDGGAAPSDLGADLKKVEAASGDVWAPGLPLVAPFTLDFEKDNGHLTGTLDWEWGPLAWAATGCATSDVPTPPKSGHSGTGMWGTKLDGCYSNLGNDSTPCNNQSTSDDSILELDVKIPSSAKSASLTFWEWIDYLYPFDWSEIRIDGQVAAQVCTGGLTTPTAWTSRTISLDGYIGKSIKITFHFMATTVVAYSGWYIDDLSVKIGS